MKEVEASLAADVRERTQFVLVTLAPERDGPAELRQYRRDNGLSGNRWRLLRGSAAATAALAARLGIGYGRDPSGLFRHASQLTVLDAAGNILLQQGGVNADLTRTVKAITDAAKPAPVVRVDRPLELIPQACGDMDDEPARTVLAVQRQADAAVKNL
jgi:cytochrome oxidase Cu insertion factor (SCO1/SenC/PrrC family)